MEAIEAMEENAVGEVEATERAGEALAQLVAVDDGYACCKLYGRDRAGKELRLVVRSSVRPGAHAVSSLDGSGLSGAYETAGRRYTVFDGIDGEATTFDGFHTSDLDRVLVHHVLMKAGLAGHPVDLVTAVPVKDYYVDGECNEALLAEKRKNLSVPVHEVRRRGDESAGLELARVRVYSQAVSAWVDHVVDSDLSEREATDMPIAVVDIGGRTTDCAVVLGGSAIDHAKSGTVNLGVIDVYKALSKELARSEKFMLDGPLPMTECDRALRTGKVMLFGALEDVQDVVNACRSEIEERIGREIHKWLGSGSFVGKVVFVGGGAVVFPGLAGMFRHGHVAADPEFANARGMWKYAMLQAAGD